MKELKIKNKNASNYPLPYTAIPSSGMIDYPKANFRDGLFLAKIDHKHVSTHGNNSGIVVDSLVCVRIVEGLETVYLSENFKKVLAKNI